jgi:hypothetical protein
MFFASDAFQDSRSGWGWYLSWEGGNTKPTSNTPDTCRGHRCLGKRYNRNTRFLQEMAGQQLQQPGGRGYTQGPRETSYLDFSETRPPLFVKAKDPLEADEWIHVIEQKFGLLRCSETQKPLFAAQ